MDRDGTFSEFELDQFGLKIGAATSYKRADAVGSAEETLNTKVVSKKCRGVVFKKKVKGDGTGSLKMSMHIPYDIYTELYGMDMEGLISGVHSYGTQSRHPNVAITCHIMDEDEVEKYKAYPNAIMESGSVRKIENGAEEVAELELEFSLMPDVYGQCEYESLATELPESGTLTASTWMTAWTSELMHTA